MRRSEKITKNEEFRHVGKLEQTFGDGEMSFEQVEDRKARSEQVAGESNITWVDNKPRISISTDSMFNLHDEEVKQLLKEDKAAVKNKASKTKELSPEVSQLLSFIS